MRLTKTSSMDEKPNKIGRPTIYTEELAEEFCSLIAQGKSVNSICRDYEDMPVSSTIFAWLAKNKEFSEKYDKATEARTAAHHEMLLEMGDEALEDSKIVDPKSSNAVVQAHKLRADNFKWAMSKMKPKKYGDRLDLTSKNEKLPTPLLYSLKDVQNNNGNEENSESKQED